MHPVHLGPWDPERASVEALYGVFHRIERLLTDFPSEKRHLTRKSNGTHFRKWVTIQSLITTTLGRGRNQSPFGRYQYHSSSRIRTMVADLTMSWSVNFQTTLFSR